jgi:hypothetical protein
MTPVRNGVRPSAGQPLRPDGEPTGLSHRQRTHDRILAYRNDRPWQAVPMAKRSDTQTEPVVEPTADQNAGKLGYKILAGVGAAVGTTVARKALDTGWKRATGKEPPSNPENPDVRWSEAVTWAVASAAIIAFVKLLAKRRVAATWQRASGTLPPGLEEPAT